MLSDREQRAVYDEQGIVDEENDSLDQNRNWEEYWRLLFPKVDQTLMILDCTVMLRRQPFINCIIIKRLHF